MKQTYLAIPRGLTDDKKIPKMLILKTPKASTINLQDLHLSIAERIKTEVKRPRPRRYDVTEEEVEDDDYEPVAKKRSRRISTSSSTSTMSHSDKFRELRDKNNEASRKSRQNRKERERDLMKELSDEEKVNFNLKARYDELEKSVYFLRKLMLQIVVSKGSAR